MSGRRVPTLRTEAKSQDAFGTFRGRPLWVGCRYYAMRVSKAMKDDLAAIGVGPIGPAPSITKLLTEAGEVGGLAAPLHWREDRVLLESTYGLMYVFTLGLYPKRYVMANVLYVDLVERYYPAGEWHCADSSKPLHRLDAKGEVVALVMPVVRPERGPMWGLSA